MIEGEDAGEWCGVSGEFSYGALAAHPTACSGLSLCALLSMGVGDEAVLAKVCPCSCGN